MLLILDVTWLILNKWCNSQVRLVTRKVDGSKHIIIVLDLANVVTSKIEINYFGE